MYQPLVVMAALSVWPQPALQIYLLIHTRLAEWETGSTGMPSNDSVMQKRMRATASWWLARSHNWAAAGMILLNGVRAKPKWPTLFRRPARSPQAPGSRALGALGQPLFVLHHRQ